MTDVKEEQNHSFLADGGETGALIRGYDWASTPVGATETWPSAFRTAVSLMLAAANPVYIGWGRDLTSLYNDGYSTIVGSKHPGIGLPFRELWPEVWAECEPTISKTLAEEPQVFIDMPIRLAGRLGAMDCLTFCCTALRDDAGGVIGVYCVAAQTAETIFAEARRRFLSNLVDTTRRLAGTEAVLEATTRLLGEHLEATRVVYADIDEAAGAATVRSRWGRAATAQLPSLIRLSDFGALLAPLRSGVTLRVADAQSEVQFAASRPALEAIGAAAIVSVPLLKDGVLIANLNVHQSSPRSWSDDDIALIEAVAERTWDAVERARAEAALRTSEEFSRRVLASSSDCVKVLGLDGRLESMSDGGRRALDVSDFAKVQNTVWAELFQPDDQAAAQAAVRSAAGGATARFDARLSTDAGEVRWWDSILTTISGEDGRPEKILALSRDITDQRAAEAALRESEARFRNMADHAPVMMWVTDPSGACLHLNRAWYEFTGQSAVEAQGFGWLDATHPDQRAEAERMFLEATAERRPFRLEYRLRRADGAYRWAIDAASPRFGPEGELLGFIGSVIDIDERREVEDRLRESEERLRLATEAAEVGFWDVDVVGEVLIWPPRVKAMFGISPDAPVTMADFYAGLHPDDYAHTAVAFEAAYDPLKRATYDVEYRTLGKGDSIVRWVAAKGRGVFDDQSRCVRVIGAAIDITARKRSDAAIRDLNQTLEKRVADRTRELDESRRRFRGIFDSTLQFMALLTPGGTVVEVNETALSWSQIQASDIVGQPFWLAAPMRGDPELQAAIEAGVRRAAAGETVREEHEMRGAGDVRAIVDFSLKPILGESGAIWLVAEGRDVTELKQAQEQLRQAQKMEAIGQLTGGVAHDFNNLLTPIVGSLDMLQRKAVGGEREQRLIAGALQSADRAKTLVQRLLAFARRQPLQPTAVDVGKLVAGMADLLASTLGPQIRLVVETADDLPAAEADPNQLEMALLNLSVNARDAMPDGGALRVLTNVRTIGPGHPTKLAPGRYVRITVADSGVGMDEATLKRAVEPFFSTKGVGKGTGLGLSMAHGLASQLGGALTIESERHVGTTIAFWIPASQTPAGAVGFADGIAANFAASGTALLVDDEALVRTSTADMLVELGYAVVEAASANEALALVRDGLRPDLIVTDHLMPGMTGTELARSLRADLQGVKVLIVSGYAEAEEIAPDLPRLSKPFRKADLMAILAELQTTRLTPQRTAEPEAAGQDPSAA